MIHRVSATVALDDPHAALTTAQQIDVTAMPVGLHDARPSFTSTAREPMPGSERILWR
jgi:hypothetical protein